MSAAPKDTASLQVAPAYAEVTLEKPDETQKLELTYTNNSQSLLELELFPIDFKQADDLGSIQLLPAPGSYSYSLSSFLSLESRSIILEPGQEKSFIVTIRNRQDLSPGGHYAAIVAKITHSDTEKVSEPKLQPAVSSLILLRKVGGERFNMSLKDVNWPGSSLIFSYPRQVLLTFQNEGNIHLIPYGRIDVKDMFGRLLYKGIINTGSLAVFPESRRHIYVDLEKIERQSPLSINTFTVTGEDSLKKTPYTFKETFIYIDPILLIGVLVLLSGGIWLIQSKKRVKNH